MLFIFAENEKNGVKLIRNAGNNHQIFFIISLNFVYKSISILHKKLKNVKFYHTFFIINQKAHFFANSLEILSNFDIQKLVSFFSKVNKFIILYCLFVDIGRKMLTMFISFHFFILIFKET